MKILHFAGLCMAFLLTACSSALKKESTQANEERIEEASKAAASSDVYKTGDWIRRDSARAKICNWNSRNSLGYKENEDSIRGLMIGKEKLLELLDPANVQGVRFYFTLSRNADGHLYRDLICIPVNSDKKDLLPIFESGLDSLQKKDVLDGMAGCPHLCAEPTSNYDCP